MKFRDGDDKDKDKDENNFDAGFTIPTTKPIVDELEEAFKLELQREHREETEELEKEGKNNKKARQRQGGIICCCGAPGCGIGPMVEKD